MKRTVFLYCLCGFILIISLSVSTPESKSVQSSISESNISGFTDSIWKVTPIVKLGDPAPGTGGTFLDFGPCYYLENGTLVFGARYGNKKVKDWALYSCKNGSVSLVFKIMEKYSEPDGIQKEFESVGSSTPEARPKIFYIAGRTNHIEGRPPSNIYGWDGDKLSKVLCEGDKISLPGNREVIIDNAKFEYVANNGEAVISFIGQKPGKIRGWLLHDGKTLRPLFIAGDELPGLPGVKVNDLDTKTLYIFNDTILTNLYVYGAPYNKAVLRFSKNKTEILDSSSSAGRIYDLSILNAAGSDNFILRKSETILQYNKGNRNIILKSFKELPDRTGGNNYEVNGSAFVGTQNEGILFSISLTTVGVNSYGGLGIAGRLPGLFFYKDDKLSHIPVTETDTANNKSNKLPGFQLFKPDPYVIRTVPRVNGVIIDNISIPKKEGIPFLPTRYLDASGIVPAVVNIPFLRTEGIYKFFLPDIIAWPAENKIIAKSSLVGTTAGFYELTK